MKRRTPTRRIRRRAPAVAALVGGGGGLSSGGTGAALSAALAALSDPSFWNSLKARLPSESPADTAQRIRPALDATMMLGLAPALWKQKVQDSRFWEFTAAVCLGVMLAGYWYTAAAARAGVTTPGAGA